MSNPIEMPVEALSVPHFTADTYIPIEFWGVDHWSTLAYMDAVMVDCGGFEVGLDARMRSNRRNYQVMAQQNPAPRRPGNANPGRHAVVMRVEHGTRLNNQQTVENHDDWSCIQDMAAAGLLNKTVDKVEPRAKLAFSSMGRAISSALRDHKTHGGRYANFKPPQIEVQTRVARKPKQPAQISA